MKVRTSLLLSFFACCAALSGCKFEIHYAGIHEEDALKTGRLVQDGFVSVFSEDVDQFSYSEVISRTFSNWDASLTTKIDFSYIRGQYLYYSSSTNIRNTILVAKDGDQGGWDKKQDSSGHVVTMTVFKKDGRFLQRNTVDKEEQWTEYASEEEFVSGLDDAIESVGAIPLAAEAFANDFLDGCIDSLSSKLSGDSSPRTHSSGGMENYLAFRDFSSQDKENSITFDFAGHDKLTWADYSAPAHYGGRIEYSSFQCVRADSSVSQEMTPSELSSAFGADNAYWAERQGRRKVVATNATTRRFNYAKFSQKVPSNVPVAPVASE